jgi:hypothetical protein
MAERRFPVLMYYDERREFPDCPDDIPWDMIAPHEKWAMYNHDQTLERLAERGGLGPREILAVLDHRPLTFRDRKRDDREAVDLLKARVLYWACHH